jgi:siroheme synthase-like protein
MSLFAMMVKLTGRTCVVIGAGSVAAAKIDGLLACGARLTVISPTAVNRIRAWAKAGKLVWHRRRFSPRHLKGAFLAIAATDSPAINATVFRACQTRKVLCNSVDDPEHCDFFYPAVVKRGPLQIAISTSGRSPALAARLRRELARQFGPEWSAFVEQVGEQRRQVLNTPPSAQRKRLLKKIAVPAEFPRGGRTSPSKTTGAP